MPHISRCVPSAHRRRGRGDTDDARHRCIIGCMTIASTAMHGAQRPLVTTPTLRVVGPPEDLRDELTRQRLLALVDHLPDVTVESFDRAWWDGQVHLPCLVVRGGRHMRRVRIVESGGDCLVVPYSRRLARRWLAARRMPRRIELDAVVRRSSAGRAVIDGWTDARRCATSGCGALRPLDHVGCCPLCGG